MPIAQVMTMPIRMFPRILLMTRKAVTRVPISARRTGSPSERKIPSRIESPKGKRPTSVVLPMTMRAFWRPMKQMKRPIPTETPTLSVVGIALKMASRTLVRDRMIKMRPSTKTAVRAVSQL